MQDKCLAQGHNKWACRSLGYLWSFRLPLLSCSSKLLVGPRSCWTSRKWMGRLAHQNRSNTTCYPCSLPTGTNHYKDQTHSLLFVETKSFSQLPILPDSFSFFGGTGPSSSFFGGTGPSSFHPLSTVPTSLPQSQPSLVLLPM